jgi:DegV family protein with EDD domain
MTMTAVITDTDSSLPADIAARYDIHLVPISINFRQESFETGIDIDDVSLFKKVDAAGLMPTTAAPSPGRFAAAYEAAFDGGAGALVCLCISSEVSTSYSAALTAAELFPGKPIQVIDTRQVSMSQGFMAIEAAEASRQGDTLERVVSRALSIGRRARLFAALSTLKYLAMGGRVSHLTAGMANLLNIKPILAVRDGKLDMVEKVRTHKKSWDRLIELAVEEAGGRSIERVAFLHVNAPAEAELLAAQVSPYLSLPDEIIMAELTPGLSVHTGSGLVGLSFIPVE